MPLPSKSPEQSSTSPGLYLVALLLLVTVGYRIIASHYDFLGNTAPLMAIAFGGALLLGARFWWVPVILLVVSDLLLGFWHGSGGVGGYTLFSIVFYLAVAWTAGKIGRSETMWPLLWCGTLLCSVLFYGFANTYSWMLWPGYEKSLAGWWQSQTIGVPGVNPPAWMFLRNALIADSIWCVIAGLTFFAERKVAGMAKKVTA
jgi:hypothetical protein